MSRWSLTGGLLLVLLAGCGGGDKTPVVTPATDKHVALTGVTASPSHVTFAGGVVNITATGTIPSSVTNAITTSVSGPASGVTLTLSPSLAGTWVGLLTLPANGTTTAQTYTATVTFTGPDNKATASVDVTVDGPDSPPAGGTGSGGKPPVPF